MKKILLIIIIFIIVACATDPKTIISTPETDPELFEQIVVSDSLFYEEIISIADGIQAQEILIKDSSFIKKDTTKEKVSRKEEQKLEAAAIEKVNNEQQKNVMNQIQKLEQQQITIDSLLKEKEKIKL